MIENILGELLTNISYLEYIKSLQNEGVKISSVNLPKEKTTANLVRARLDDLMKVICPDVKFKVMKESNCFSWSFMPINLITHHDYHDPDSYALARTVSNDRAFKNFGEQSNFSVYNHRLTIFTKEYINREERDSFMFYRYDSTFVPTFKTYINFIRELNALVTQLTEKYTKKEKIKEKSAEPEDDIQTRYNNIANKRRQSV